MTINTAINSQFSRPRASGIDRLVMRLSLAGLRWARRRADRAAVSREEHAARYRAHVEAARREHENAARTHLVRY